MIRFIPILLVLSLFVSCQQAEKEVDTVQLADMVANKSQIIQEHNGRAFRDLNKNGQLDIYEDASRPIEERVEDLLSQMSVKSRVNELKTGTLADPYFAMLKKFIGGIIFGAGAALGMLGLFTAAIYFDVTEMVVERSLNNEVLYSGQDQGGLTSPPSLDNEGTYLGSHGTYSGRFAHDQSRELAHGPGRIIGRATAGGDDGGAVFDGPVFPAGGHFGFKIAHKTGGADNFGVEQHIEFGPGFDQILLVGCLESLWNALDQRMIGLRVADGEGDDRRVRQEPGA